MPRFVTIMKIIAKKKKIEKEKKEAVGKVGVVIVEIKMKKMTEIAVVKATI